MRDRLGPGTVLGYCTNVHPGASYPEMLENLERHALAVKARVSPERPMGVGLWLSAGTVETLRDAGRRDEFAAWLRDHGLLPFTFNGFPFGDFHRGEVKHRVYAPDWTTEDRTRYTIELAEIQARLLGEAEEGSISTLPVGWRAAIESTAGGIEKATRNLLRVADHLAQLEETTGKWIHLDLEPEPGCYLDTSKDVVRLFEKHLLPNGDEHRVRRHLGVCHDICHAAVMFEEQESMLERYRAAGIRVGKVQLSAAVRAEFGSANDARRDEVLNALKQFRERRYLHQTVVRTANDQRFFEDLSNALATAEPEGEWRVHFHVPLFLERFGALRSTSDEVERFLRLAGRLTDVRHFEAETYAWDVLPEPLRSDDLAAGIARELSWVVERNGVSSTA